MTTRDRTHWDGCWRTHAECAYAAGAANERKRCAAELRAEAERPCDDCDGPRCTDPTWHLGIRYAAGLLAEDATDAPQSHTEPRSDPSEGEDTPRDADGDLSGLRETVRRLRFEVAQLNTRLDSSGERCIKEFERAVAAEHKLAAVRELHMLNRTSVGDCCDIDGHPWPCDTVRALDDTGDGDG